MIFWRNKKNAAEQEREAQEDRLIHPPDAPEIEPATESGSESRVRREPPVLEEMEQPESVMIESLEELPVPSHDRLDDVREAHHLRDRTEEGGWLARLTKGLSKTSSRLGQGITQALTARKLDSELLGKLEEALIEADLGPGTAAKIIEAFSQEKFGKDVSEQDVRDSLATHIAEILRPVAGQLETTPVNGKPRVVLVTGVNGVGKTTTIGKLAYAEHVRTHRRVMMAAADTFRAAAVEQLEIWARRAHCPLVSKDIATDPAAVAFEAYERACAEGMDLLLIDTAGRLHNKSNLMAQLEKIVRVLKKQDPSAPHDVLLVLDATTGQNAHAQVEAFRDIVNVSGLIITKLDGSARGGVVVGLADRFGLPVYAIGVGEDIEDLQAFHPEAFARALVGAAV